MRRKSIVRRLAIAGAATLALAGASLAVASPAQATPADCTSLLAAQGYGGVEYGLACTLGDISYTLCATPLGVLGVPPLTADLACRLAAA
ncbi:hypothetical protein [Catellatospora tritici]|uniref:hypothetical protein n=1 Tax=Catellatospora tritici TaxID=2851566 RepID=UPI001C2DD0BA|nr:hypothetical protein [Catellatospora tritici]MBV1855293.1 hypothetical protein [Catellatospora tritici]